MSLPPAPSDKNSPTGFWPHGWWKIMELRIGILPLPVYLLLLFIVAWFAMQPGTA